MLSHEETAGDREREEREREREQERKKETGTKPHEETLLLHQAKSIAQANPKGDRQAETNIVSAVNKPALPCQAIV